MGLEPRYPTRSQCTIKKSSEEICLEGRGARSGFGENHACCTYKIDRGGKKRDRLQRTAGWHDDELRGSLMPEMAIRAMRVVNRTLVIPVADDAGRKNHQRNERERDPEEANCFTRHHFSKSVST